MITIKDIREKLRTKRDEDHTVMTPMQWRAFIDELDRDLRDVEIVDDVGDVRDYISIISS